MNGKTSSSKRADAPARFATGFALDLCVPLATPHPQPSLRIPVTPANRECLRALRAAESVVWEKGGDLRCAVLAFTRSIS